jgi:hypothetical protein
VRRRGIVVVHGVGTQQREDQLDIVVEPLVEFLGQALGHGNVELVTRPHRAGERLVSATIHLRDPHSGQWIEEWHVREAWWAESFVPSSSRTVLGWAVRAFGFFIAATLRNVWWRNVRRAFLGPQEPQGHGVWTIPTGGRFYSVLDALAWGVIMGAYLLLAIVGFCFIVPLYTFLSLPLLPIIPQVVADVRRSLINLITGGIGDQQAMTNRRVAVSAAANVISTALYPFLDPSALDEHHATYETVTMLAHSGGCVVPYEALAGEQVTQWLAADPPGRRVNFVTLGSGLNLAWKMRAPHKDRDWVFWHRRMDHQVNWVDIYARYDPVPQGAAPEELVDALMGADQAARPYVSVRVANDDWPPTDHGAYWWNFPEVMSRVVDVISDSRWGQAPLDTDPGEFTDGLLHNAVVQAVTKQGVPHRRKVTTAQTLRLVFGLGTLALLGAYRANVIELGQRVASLAGWPWAPTRVWESLADRLLPPLPWLPELLHWLVGAIIVVFILSIGLTLLRLAGDLWSWGQPQHDAVPPAGILRP